ncbi:hypothetical protein [Dolichospermum phage Dfl-JY45]
MNQKQLPFVAEARAALLNAYERLQAERGKGGWDSAQRRESALSDGLVALAALHGRDLPVCSYQSTGEFSLALVLPRTYPDPAPTFGVGFAADLGRVETRQGTVPLAIGPGPESNWLFVNHFAAETLVAAVAEDFQTGRRAAVEALYGALERAGGRMLKGLHATADGALAGVVRPSADGRHTDEPVTVEVTGAGELRIDGHAVNHADAVGMDAAIAASAARTQKGFVRDPWAYGEDEAPNQRDVAPSPSM